MRWPSDSSVPDAARIVSRLIYLDGVSPPFALNRETLEAAAADVAGFLDKACELLSRGRFMSGSGRARAVQRDAPCATRRSRRLLHSKAVAFGRLTRELDPLWSAP